ncbi:MAG: 50S ribosomal protein L22 [Patescibacteria group bacterium]
MAEKVEQKIQEVRASIGDLHIAPRKTRLVTDLIKKLPVEEALRQLQFLNKKAARPIAKLLNSAIANAKHNFQINREELQVKNITVNQGNSVKRFMPRAQGRAFPIQRRTSIVEVILVGGYKKSKKAKARKTVVAAPQPVASKEEELKTSKEQPQPKWKDKGAGGGKIRQKFVDMKRRLFNRKTNA